jgi:hypothetical protein
MEQKIKKAVEWFMNLPVKERVEMADKYYPEYKEDQTDLEDNEIEMIYSHLHPQTTINTTTLPLPLYKRLNEERTQGEWILKDAAIIKNCTKSNSLDNGELKILQCYQSIEGNSFEYKHLHPEIEKAFEENPALLEKVITTKNVLANAAYSALAVNNLHLLAEALEDTTELLKWLHSELTEEGKAVLIKAKEALNKIS